MSLLSFVRSSLLPLATVLSAYGPLGAQQDDAAMPPCNKTQIQWVLPGNFDAARQRAVTEQRMLLIKGISFGIDEAGAQCATKGLW
jgi:hypothetical protein